MSQAEQILFNLRAHSAGVCGTTFLAMHIPRYAARVQELRNGRRLNIVTETCDRPGHVHSSRQVQYRLLESGAML